MYLLLMILCMILAEKATKKALCSFLNRVLFYGYFALIICGSGERKSDGVIYSLPCFDEYDMQQQPFVNNQQKRTIITTYERKGAFLLSRF